MRKPVAVIQKQVGEFLVFCGDGSVWMLYHSTGDQYEWARFGTPLPGSEAAEKADNSN